MEQIADSVYLSKFHFHRLFLMVAGQSIGDYLFKRRMTNAVELLEKNKGDVLSVAIRCGYNSQEAFTRAFKEYFKVTPGKYDSIRTRRDNMLCFPLTAQDIQIYLGEANFDYEIVSLDQITLLGFDYLGNNKKKELSLMCNEFIQFMFHECRDNYDQASELFGYNRCEVDSNMDEMLYYMIGIEEPENASELKEKCSKMKQLIIPENTYAKFTLTSNIDRLHFEIGSAYKSLLKQGCYFPMELYGLERYDRTFMPNDENSSVEFYIPVIKDENIYK